MAGIGSTQADAPPQAARFAAFAQQNSGDLMVAYALWSEVARTSPNPYLRDNARREMARIQEAMRENRRTVALRHLGTPQVILK